MPNDALRRTRTSPHAVLTQILEQPELARAIEALDGQSFTKLVRHVGLEDAGELLTLATRDQLELFLDEELWSGARPGEDERFDADRFALWLEVLLEAGDRHAAMRLAELSEELLLLGFSRHLLVIDIDALAVDVAHAESDETEWLEKALDSCLYQEFERFRVMGRRAAGWDAVIGALLALDRDHHDLVERLLERATYASSELIEENGGLYAVLSSKEMIESDAAGEREERRARAGYVAPSSARSFLALARTTPLSALVRGKERDPVTRAYFRELDRSPRPTPSKRRRGATQLARLLRDAGVLPHPTRETPLLPGSSDGGPLVVHALTRLLHAEPKAHAERLEELAYLANVIAVGVEGTSRPTRAVERAIAICERGLDHVLGAHRTIERALEVLRERSLDQLFRVGWHLAAAAGREPEDTRGEPRRGGTVASDARRSDARAKR